MSAQGLSPGQSSHLNFKKNTHLLQDSFSLIVNIYNIYHITHIFYLYDIKNKIHNLESIHILVVSF